MNKAPLIILSTLPIIALTCSLSAIAHTAIGSLGQAASATDFYLVKCTPEPEPTEHLFFQISGVFPKTAPPVSAQVFKDISVSGSAPAVTATNVTDPVNDGKTSSRSVEVHGGDGNYLVTVDKAGAGIAYYSFEFHCQSATGLHTGTSEGPPSLQNQ